MNEMVMLGIHHIEHGLRTSEKLLLCECLDEPAKFVNCRFNDLCGIIGRKPVLSKWNPEELMLAAEKDKEFLNTMGIKPIYYFSTEYPPLLREIYDPPFLLYRRGEYGGTEVPALAVVGTRRPTGQALSEAYELAFNAAKAGIPVVSGLALGIDAAAHRGALDGGGVTIAVLGNGIDHIYPKSNKSLAAEILDKGGAILSEYPAGVTPRRYHFPARNRIISGICRGTVIVQAPKKSGALITADYALEQGRDLFVHERGIGAPHGRGGEELAEQGCRVIKEISDILKEWEWDKEWRNPTLFSHGVTSRQDIKENPGRGLAVLLKEELSGKIACYNGTRMRRAV